MRMHAQQSAQQPEDLETRGPSERLPSISKTTIAKHKRCVSFQESQIREKMMRKYGAESALHNDTDGLSKYNDTLEEISKLIGKSSRRKKATSIDEVINSDFRTLHHPIKSIHFLRSNTESRLGLPVPAMSHHGSTNQIRLVSHQSNTSLISTHNLSRDSASKRDRKSSAATEEISKLEKDLLLEYLDSLARALHGEDILKLQATALFSLEYELRLSDLKKASAEKERTILESLDGSISQSRTIDNWTRLDQGSHQSLNQYKFKLQEVNKQMSIIEQYRKQIDSLESDLGKLDQRRDLLAQKSQIAFEIRRLEDVVLFDAEKRPHTVYSVF
jgi:hypothetical protein